MTTHRSLNKLEFKAHMNIHNLIDVPDSEDNSSNFTRDRFGKKHALVDSQGKTRLKRSRLKISVSVVIFLCLFSLRAAFAETLSPSPKKGPNFSVTSDDPEVRSMKDRMNSEGESYGIPMGSATLGLNEDGDPSLGTRF